MVQSYEGSILLMDQDNLVTMGRDRPRVHHT